MTQVTQTVHKTSDALINVEDVRQGTWYAGDQENIVQRMNRNAKDEAVKFISDRIETATDQTNEMRTVMSNSDKQYKGEWQSTNASKDEDIYLPMTREDINAVRAYLISILAQIIPIIRMQPSGSGTIWELEQDVKRAKLAEAMFNYYWRDQWKALDDVMPKFLTHFLKYPLGILKVGYYETEHNPDLTLENIDRGFLYIDPRSNTLHEAGWIGHEYYIPRSEIFNRVERDEWFLSEIEMAQLQTIDGSIPQATNMERWFGKQRNTTTTLLEDELVKCIDYWQFPKNGLGDLFATVIGTSVTANTTGITDGVLVRYGPNPFPYKGNPFIGASFNPDDRPDGQSMAMLQEPFQKVANTLYNIRIADVRKNVRDATLMLEQMVDKQTIKDIKNGNRIVRAAKAFNEFIVSNPSAKMSDFVSPFPSGTSTGEILIQDLQFILNMGQKSANTPDVFRGLNAQPGATLGQIQEQLSRTTGQFTPITRSIMRVIERIAQVSVEYFRSEEFYPSERMIRIVGKNAYKDTIDGWHEVDQNTAYKSVTADDTDVDMVFDAISGADMIASKTLLMTTFERIMQGLGQVPDMYNDIRKEINFANYAKQVLNVSGLDIEGLTYTDDEKERNAKQEEAERQKAIQEQMRLQQQQMQMQAQMSQMQSQLKQMEEANKQQLMAQKQVTVDNNKIANQAEVDYNKIELESDTKIDEIQAEAQEDGINAILQGEIDKDKMDHEAELEAEALAQGKTVSVGRDSDNVVLDQGTTKQP
jgi:hypothetical protein